MADRSATEGFDYVRGSISEWLAEIIIALHLLQLQYQ